MEEPKKTPGTETSAEPKKEEKGGKSFSQEELDRVLAKRLADEREKHEQQLEEARKEAKAEAERLAKLSAEEREAQLKEQQEREFKERSESVTIRENTIDAREALSELGIPGELAELVVDLDGNKQKEKITKVSTAWKKAVEKGIEEKLKGTPPKDFNAAKDTAKKVAYTF
jgi:hypothetical protein